MTMGSAERVVCLAFDSPGNSILEAGLDAGRLPTLASLLTHGQAAALADRQELLTPPTWPTMIRGCELSDHGLGSDSMQLQDDYRISDISPEHGAQPPFWRHISDAGISSVILSVYSAPILDPFLGVQVAGWGSHDPFDAKLGRLRSDPPELIPDLERHVGKRAIAYHANPPRGARAVRAYVRDMVRGCGQQGSALTRLLKTNDWRFAFASFAESHQAGHWLWDLADPAHPDHDPSLPADLRDGLMRIYEATDRAIGEVVSSLPPDTVVLVISPYSMGPNHHLDEAFPEVLERGGWLVRRPAAESGTRLRALRAGRRIVRAAVPLGWRPALGRLAGRDRLLAELAVGSIDWALTAASPVPSDGSSSLRLNLVGRDPEGRIRPGPEANRMLGDITESLLELRCADTGKPVVARVARFEELYDSAPPPGCADLFVQWARVPRPRAVYSKRVGEVPVPTERSIRSVHYSPGFAVAAGPGIPPSGETRLTGRGEARVVDVAATALALLGVPVPTQVTGRPIPELVPLAVDPAA